MRIFHCSWSSAIRGGAGLPARLPPAQQGRDEPCGTIPLASLERTATPQPSSQRSRAKLPLPLLSRELEITNAPWCSLLLSPVLER